MIENTYTLALRAGFLEGLGNKVAEESAITGL